MEGRALGEIDLGKETSMRPIESQIKTDTKLKRIAWLSQQDAKKEFSDLMHLFSHLPNRKRKAPAATRKTCILSQFNFDIAAVANIQSFDFDVLSGFHGELLREHVGS